MNEWMNLGNFPLRRFSFRYRAFFHASLFDTLFMKKIVCQTTMPVLLAGLTFNLLLMWAEGA